MKKPYLLLFFFIILSSCSVFTVQPPEGFAVVRKSGDYFKAVSPEGVIFQMRTAENYPEKDLRFWSEALNHHLLEEGYRLVSRETVLEDNGVYFEWGVPYNNESYVYLTALYVKGKSIVIAECTGPYDIYSKYREGMLETLNAVTLN